MISIIIPAYNNHELTKTCLEFVRAYTQDYEIVIVDNGSTPAIEGATVRNEENKGFPVAINQGIREAKGDVIILLNNDCVVTPNWTAPLLAALKEYDIAGPLTNFASGLQRVIVPIYNDQDELNQRAAEIAKANKGQIQRVKWVIGFCMAFRKSLFDEIGPFDESIWPCCGEELDFCMRAHKAGKKIGIVKDGYVHHFGSKTFAAMNVDYEKICKANNKHLETRWGKSVCNQTYRTEGVKINLGCGLAHIPGYINIDNRPAVKPDLVCDVMKGLPYEDGTVDEVWAYDFLEHIPIRQTGAVIDEIWRVLKPGGIFESFTPDAENGQGAFQDPHHISFWVENSWLYYSDPACRALYGTKANFSIESIERRATGNRVFHLLVIATARKEG